MKNLRRILAVMLCALLCVSPLCVGLAEAVVEPGMQVGSADAAAQEAGAQPDVSGGGSAAAGNVPEPPETNGDAAPVPGPEGGDAAGADVPDAGGDGNAQLSDDEISDEAPDGGVAAEGDADTSGDGTTAEGDADISGDGTLAEGEDGGASDAGDAAEPPAIDSGSDATHSPAFEQGYAELIGDTVIGFEGPGTDGRPVLLLRTGVVYARSRAVSAVLDRLEAVFDAGGGQRVVWIDAGKLRPLSAEESAAFVERRGAEEGALFLDEQRTLPLDLIEVKPLSDDGGEPSQPGTTPGLNVPLSELTLGVGEIRDIGASFSDGEAHGISYVSGNSAVARVFDDGRVKGKGKGQTDIVLTSEFGEEKRVHVTVHNAPTSVSLHAPRLKLGVNEQLMLTATLPEGQFSPLRFSIPPEQAAIATVSEEGLVTTFSEGKFTVTVSTFNGKTASVTLKVKSAPTAIALERDQLTLGVSQSTTLSATLSPAGSAGKYSFRAEPSEIVRVDADSGELEALAVGSAVVTVETYNHVSAACDVEVRPAPTQISFAEDTILLGTGERVSVPVTMDEGSAAGLSYESSNNGIASVNKSGIITGVKAGKATITVTAHNGPSAQLTVRVRPAPMAVMLSAPRTVLGVGETVQLTPVLPTGAASYGYKYSSNNEDVLRVDDAGLLTAQAEGSGAVIVETFNGARARLKFTVKAAPAEIRFDQRDISLGVAQEATLTAALNEGSAGAYSFALEEGKQAVLELDPATGAVKALALGEAQVTVTAYNGVSDSATVTVLPAPDSLSLSFTTAVIGVGEKIQPPQVQLTEGSAASLSYESSDDSIASVNTNGRIRGVRTGRATITIAAHNGVSAVLTVKVRNAPAAVRLSAHHSVLGVGEAVQLTPTLPAGTASYGLKYSSNNEEVLRVDDAGLVTAQAEGSGAVIVETFNGARAKLKFTVVAQPTAVALPETLALGKNEQYTIDTAFTPSDAGGGRTYSVDDTTIATIDPASGAIHALVPGSTVVRVETYNGCKAECALTVKNKPTGVAFQEGVIKLGVGDTRQLLPPVLKGEDVASGKLTYRSSNKAIVKVSPTGLVTAVRQGNAAIGVSTYNGKSAILTVKVKAAPKSIEFEEKEHRLVIHDSFTPTVKFANNAPGSYALESSDPAIAAVEGTSVRGVSAGSVTLTATSYNGKQATMQVNVPILPERVWLEPAILTLGEGDSDSMFACAPEGQGALMTYSVDDEGIAAYEAVDNETITVRAVSMGETTIHVQSENGCDAQAQVRVLRAPTVLRLFPDHAQYCIDERQFQLQWGYGSAEEGGSVRFTSSDESIATVSRGGLVSFLRTGTVQISAQTYNGHTASCELQIGERPGKMSFAQEEYQLALGDSVRLDASFETGCESYVLHSEDGAIVSTSGDRVRGEALGSTRVTAVGSVTGQEAGCTVTVVAAPEGVEFTQTEASLVFGVNSTLQLSARALPSGVGSVIYSSSDPSIATVDSASGLVTALKKGECTIYATTYDGLHRAECPATVSYLLEGVKIGIDPGHQAKGNLEKERVSPNSSRTKNKVAYPSSGVAHVREDIIDLQISFRLRDALEKLGAEVYLTRESADVDISNKERAEMFNKLGVDFALRIHANSWINGSAQGLSIIRRKTWAYPKGQGNGNAVMAAEAKLGNAIAAYFRQRTGCKWRGLGTSDEYTMNNWSKVPCLLVEVGFMTHPVEGMNIVKPAYQKKMVKGIIEGICSYKGLPLPKEW